MKLSEMSTDRIADVLCDIADPLSAMANDTALKDALSLFRKDVLNNNAAFFAAFAKAAPVLLKTHRTDLYTIIAALTGKTRKQVGEQPLPATIEDLQESIDQEIIDFFKRALAQTSASPQE